MTRACKIEVAHLRKLWVGRSLFSFPQPVATVSVSTTTLSFFRDKGKNICLSIEEKEKGLLTEGKRKRKYVCQLRRKAETRMKSRQE